MIIPTEAECLCGIKVNMDVYDSVNVTLDPKLYTKVLNKKINYYQCKKCGRIFEPAFQFLYHDMKKGYLIWVVPEKLEDGQNKDIYAKELIESCKNTPLNALSKFYDKKIEVVFGYNELFKLIL